VTSRVGDSFQHVAFTVSDVTRTIHFYERLGFALKRRYTASGADVAEGVGVSGASLDIALIEIPSGQSSLVVELIGYTPMGSDMAPANNDIGSAHICLAVPDLIGIYTELSADGVQFISAPHWSDELGWVYLRDPDGITIELVEHVDTPR
jgi:catechol 2,3-dioxygenase-like lactoylglutathione lyase family enzyme